MYYIAKTVPSFWIKTTTRNGKIGIFSNKITNVCKYKSTSCWSAFFVRFFYFNSDVAGGDGRGNSGSKIAWKITDENGEYALLFFAGGGRGVFTVFLKRPRQVCDERNHEKGGGRYAMNAIYL